MSSPVTPPNRIDGRGLAAATSAFFIWGLLPLYLRLLHAVPVLQITAHRLVWGCIFAMIWLAIRGQLSLVRAALLDPQTAVRLCLSAVLISINWITYVYGIAVGRVVETSLGYFINPLVNVLLGVLVLSERLNKAQWTAVAIAAAGVSYLTWNAGHLPWIALSLAFSFGFYGLVRKLIKVEALPGFGSETLVLLPVGIGYLVWSEVTHPGGWSSLGFGIHALLVFGGPLTAIPLVLFAVGARRIPYSTVGLLQYLAPTIQFLLAIFVFHEPFTQARLVGFAMIWTALAIYAGDGVWRSRKLAPLAR